MSIFTDQYGNISTGAVIATIVVGALSLLLLFVLFPFTLVGETQRGLVFRNGALVRTVDPGLNFRIPLIEDVKKADTSVQTFTMSVPVYSKDSQVVETEVTVNYHIDSNLVEEAYRDSQLAYEMRVIAPNMPDVLESSLSKYSAQELITSRGTLSGDVKAALFAKLETRPYIVIETVSVKLDFDDAYEAAVKEKQVQEQNALTAINVTKQTEEKKKQDINAAEALAEKTRLEALALASQQGSRVIEKIYAEAALEMAKKWQGGVPQTVVNGSDSGGGNGFFSFLQLTKSLNQ